MLNSPIKTPGVYIEEVSAFPNSVLGVPTSVPAFIGYTPQTIFEGKSSVFKARKIRSFAEFEIIYGMADPVSGPCYPQYYVLRQNAPATSGETVAIGGVYNSVVPDPDTFYYLYNSIRLFYANGGGDAYIVSVGGYGPPSKKQVKPGEAMVNENVKLADLSKGLKVLKHELETTMYVCPDATLLSVEDNGKLMQAMLLQCTEMKTAMSIFDVIGGRNPDAVGYTNDIATFRTHTGSVGLMYGAAYFPFIGTTMLQSSDMDYRYLFGGDLVQLRALLLSGDPADKAVSSILDRFENGTVPHLTCRQLHQILFNTSAVYKTIMERVQREVNLLPASAAMAGVMTTIDNQRGVWKAPANISINGAVSLPIQLSDVQQQDLNTDATSGKSINAIRSFPGHGILVWGARTLDGNSNEWRYIPVRRTMTYLEQSCMLATRGYVFEPNVSGTWMNVKAMIENFLSNIWREGGFAGSKPAEAFGVDVGLGSTMTADDILNGVMRVSVRVALIRPAEFMIFSFEQRMQQS